MTRIAIIIGLVLTCALGVARAQSPGPLARDHAALEGLDKCIRCHSGGDVVSVPRCLDCHVALGKRIAANAGYHATTGSDCGKCHPDHRGVGRDLVSWPGGRDRFEHAKLARFALDGGHAKIACRDCHKPAFLSGGVASALSIEERPRTYLGLGTTCIACHADTHKPTLGTDCQRCHDARGWHAATTSTAFDHARTKYPLAGAHAKVDCAKCHGGTTAKLADLHPKFDTCRTCHQDPHAGTLGTAPTVCATCHRETAWKELRYDRRTHAPRTLPLTNGHAKPTCASCHGAKLDKKLATTCLGCHPDKHKPSLGTRCETCHQTTAWTTSAPPKIEFHDRTSYPLRGLHATVACAQCHDPKKPAAKRYRPLKFGTCLDCHADPHLGEASRPCATCHAVDGWKPPRFEATDHARTRFALDGAHRAVPCGKCHPSAPKSPGFKQGNPACETCHADPHAGQFKAVVCASCHGVTAWSPSTFTKDAHATAGFALAGKHDVACGRCHARTTTAAITRFTDTATECGACHADRHAGQFVGRKCVECHAGAAWKPTPGFDHGKTFVLRERHAAIACVRCHPTTSIAGVAVEVYKLGKPALACAGCHRDQHGDASSKRAQPRALAMATRACASCHVESTWKAIARAPVFDHATTGAPLAGGHAEVACATCHKLGGRALPALEACASCHADRHAGRLGERCESCHTATSWKQDRILVDHQRTRLPLLGAHAVQGCPTCHKDVAPGTFRGLSPSCGGCHQHTLEERRPHPKHEGTAFARCEDCHSSLGWRPSQFNHDRFWALTGKHQSTPCSKCHKTGEPYSAAPTRCNGCHADIDHQGLGSLGLECEKCHTTTSWKPSTFNHTSFFPLGGKHRGITCGTCHTVKNTPAMFSCIISGACHTNDHHQNQGSSGCYRCHPNGQGGD